MDISNLRIAAIVGIVGLAAIAANDSSNLNREPSNDPEATWGLHEPLQSCASCHSRTDPDKGDLVATVPKLCYTCHEDHTSPNEWEHGPVATGNCLLCHEPHNTKNKSLLSKPVPELCYHCHETSTLRPIANHCDESHTRCTNCHESHASPGRMLLKRSYLKTDAGRAYLSNNAASRRRPNFVYPRNSLEGLKGVAVISTVEGPNLVEHYGVTKDLVTEKVERKLHKNGIKILNAREQTTRKAVLHVRLRLVEVPSRHGRGQVEALSGSFRMSLQQTVELLDVSGEGKRRLCMAQTWDTDTAKFWGLSQIEEGIDEAVEVLVGRFGADYAKANPKEKTPESGPAQ